MFVAGFIGTPQMNFFDADLKKKDGKYYACVESATIAVPDYIGDALNKKENIPEKVTMGVRPENLIICDDDATNSIRADIKVTEMMGSEIHIHAVCSDGKKIIIRVQIADMTDEEQIALLQRTSISFTTRERTINLFDTEDGRNLAVENAVPVPKKAVQTVNDESDKNKRKKKKN